MREIEFSCPPVGSLRVFGKRLHDGHDFVALSNARDADVDYLIFLDSRGVSRNFENSLAQKLLTEISQLEKKYVLICRPLELTTWATLIGFLRINKIKPAKIITNLGFVDFTPKKTSILQDALDQGELVLGKGVAEYGFVENHLSASGVIPLYSMRYTENYRRAIEDISAQYELVVINTPLVAVDIAIERKRPVSFFSAQMEANEFNKTIAHAQVIDLPNFDESLTYDAVHYTDRGNEVVFDKVKSYL